MEVIQYRNTIPDLTNKEHIMPICGNKKFLHLQKNCNPMETSNIQSITLGEIINHAKRYNTHIEKQTYKGCLISHYSISEHIEEPFFDYPTRIDAKVFFICTKGSAKFSCNLKEYTLNEGTLLFIPPRCLVNRSETSDEHEGYVVFFDTDFLGECNFNLKQFTSLMMQISENVCITLKDTELQRLMRATSTLEALILEQITSSFRDDIIRSMIETLMYQFCEVFSVRIDNKTTQGEEKLSRQENYFRRFIKELSEHYTERQNVTYYAEKLCISSRYLTTIVRKVSGLSVTDWMNKYLLMEAKYLLKYSDMSIQEIAYRLSFPDQSFFGKYFKQHTGVAPSTYRNQ